MIKFIFQGLFWLCLPLITTLVIVTVFLCSIVLVIKEWKEFRGVPMTEDYSYLPDIHRPNGERPFHDDWVLYKWFGVRFPRWFDARPAGYPPRVLAGSLALLFNT